MDIKEAARKFNAYDQTIICDMFPENPQISPKNNLNRPTPKKEMTIISTVTIEDTMARIRYKSFLKLTLFLNFSDSRCSRTLEMEVAIRVKGMDRINFDRSKKPAISDEKNLFTRITGRRKLNPLMKPGIKLNFGNSEYLSATYFMSSSFNKPIERPFFFT